MGFWAYLRRELILATRRKTLFGSRCIGVLLAGSIALGVGLVYDDWGWDRSSVVGIRSFSLAVLGVYIAVLLVLVLGLMVNAVAPSIALERDRKTLDALLASEITAAEIILGAMGSGLLRFSAKLAADLGGESYCDWAGGLIWLCLPGEASHADTVRAALAPHGGHATLIRASAAERARTAVFQPLEGALAALTKRVKESFDPGLVLNPGRMHAGM